MADLRFSRATLAGLVTTVGARVQAFDDEAAALGLAPEEAERLKRAMGFSTRHVVADSSTTTADLCLHSARHLLRGLDLQPDAVDGLILVTQTPDYSSPSTSIGMQHRLGMRTDTLCFDIRLGCSGFVYGLSVAYSLVESGLNRVLLCVGDVASRMVAIGDRSITPIMGDAGAAVLIERREKIKSTYLTAVNPIVNPALDGKGLTFENGAVTAGVGQGPASYRASWMAFDNATGATKPLSETQSSTTTIPAPAGLPSSGFVAVDIAADSADHPAWKQPVRAFFRQDGGSWKLVGLERMPDKPNPRATQKVSK